MTYILKGQEITRSLKFLACFAFSYKNVSIYDEFSQGMKVVSPIESIECSLRNFSIIHSTIEQFLFKTNLSIIW